MKKIPVLAVIILIVAAIAAIGSVSFLGPCVHEDGSFGACHWAGRALLGVSCLIAVESLAVVLLPDQGMRRGLYFSIVLCAVLGILVPGTLISLCGMASMRCRALMRPAMTILHVLMGLLALAGLVLERKRK